MKPENKLRFEEKEQKVSSVCSENQPNTDGSEIITFKFYDLDFVTFFAQFPKITSNNKNISQPSELHNICEFLCWRMIELLSVHIIAEKFKYFLLSKYEDISRALAILLVRNEVIS